MGSQEFCLRWNNHQTNMLSVFDQLLSNGDFVDVTLSCSSGNIKAHKMVLSACSPYFQELFRDNPCKHPIVILKDMKIKELKAIVEFMYKGEINVSQDQLPTLLKTAESLKIKGLAEVSSSGSEQSKELVTGTPSSTQKNDSSSNVALNNNNGVHVNDSTQSEGRVSPYPKRRRHRAARKQSNDDSNHEEPDDNTETSQDVPNSNVLKSEPLELNEPEIDLVMEDEQYHDNTVNDHDNSVKDGNSKFSQSEIMEMVQPSTSGIHGNPGKGSKRNGKLTVSIAKKKKNQALKSSIAASNPTSNPKDRKESTVWSYYSCDNDNKIVECLLCQRLFKKPGNTTNLFDHLKRRHFSHWQKLDKNGFGGSPMFWGHDIPAPTKTIPGPKPKAVEKGSRPRSIYARQYRTNIRGSVDQKRSGNNTNDSFKDDSKSPSSDPPSLTVGVNESNAAETLEAAQGLAATAAKLNIPF